MTSNKVATSAQPSSAAANAESVAEPKKQARPTRLAIESPCHSHTDRRRLPGPERPFPGSSNGLFHRKDEEQQPNQSRRMAHEFAEVYKKCKQIADSAHHSSDLLDGDLSYELGVFGLLRPHYFNEQPKMSPKMIEVYQREHKIFWTVVCAELPAAAERRKRHMTPP